MTTLRKSQSARTNGAKSKGPITPEGKAAVAQNAVRHGIFSRSIVLGCESQDRFQQLLEALTDQVQPRNSAEMDYVETMTIARWRQMRVWGIQKAAIELEMARLDGPSEDDLNGDTPADLPPVVRATLAFRALAGNASILDLLHRYETSYDRQFMRAQAAIHKLRRQEPQAAEIEATPTLRSPLTAPTFNESTQDGGTPVPQPVSSDLRCSVKRSRGKSSTGRRLFATSY